MSDKIGLKARNKFNTDFNSKSLTRVVSKNLRFVFGTLDICVPTNLYDLNVCGVLVVECGLNFMYIAENVY